MINAIFVLIIVYFTCCAKTCSEDDNDVAVKERESVIELRDSIKQVFGTSLPGNQYLRALETTARLKLIEFSDYLKIVSDSSVDIRLREQAGEMIKTLFVSDGTDVRKWNIVLQNTDIDSLEQMIGASLSKGMPCWIRPYEITVSVPLTLENDSTFTGRLSFKMEYVPFIYQDKEKEIHGVYMIDIHAVRKLKIFGTDSIYVWEANLGDFK